jgi:hypothetical protein
MVPALRKLREERGTRFVGDANEIKGWATRPKVKIFAFLSCLGCPKCGEVALAFS